MDVCQAGLLSARAVADVFAVGLMAALDLRDYQAAFIADFNRELLRGQRKIMGVAPTGAGKTVIAAAIARQAAAASQRVLFLVHRRELVSQSSQKLYDVGLDHGIIAAGFPTRPAVSVQVASISTLHARAVRCSNVELPRADLVIVDEAHHAPARTWHRLIDAYPAAGMLGLSATPCRADGRGLGDIFKVMVQCPPIAALIGSGYLVPTCVYAPTRPDLDGVRVHCGDYIEAELADRMDRPQLVGDVVAHWHRLGDRRRTIVFATSVAHAVHLRDEFGRYGVAAAHVDGTTPTAERDAILAGLASGAIEVVTNCGVLTEGFDLPAIGCIVLARPTKSFGLYRQMVGRGLRPGKDHCLVLDHASCTHEHGFIDEPVEWTLVPDKRPQRPAQTARAARRATTLVDCPECSAARWQGQPCPACGWRPQAKPQDVEVVDGELGLVSRDGTVENAAAAAEKNLFYGQLLWIARERGYKAGWAAHKFREKFSAWPGRKDVEPVPPTPALLSWVRSRQIAYAKAMQKARAA
jgi:superfamily II DNA or RNA helicase